MSSSTSRSRLEYTGVSNKSNRLAYTKVLRLVFDTAALRGCVKMCPDRVITFQQENYWHPVAHWLVSRVRPETGRKNILQNAAVKVRFKI